MLSIKIAFPYFLKCEDNNNNNNNEDNRPDVCVYIMMWYKYMYKCVICVN